MVFPPLDAKRWSLVAVTARDLASANQTCLFRVSVTGEQSREKKQALPCSHVCSVWKAEDAG